MERYPIFGVEALTLLGSPSPVPSESEQPQGKISLDPEIEELVLKFGKAKSPEDSKEF